MTFAPETIKQAEDAVTLVDSAAALAAIPRSEHVRVMEALKFLRSFIADCAAKDRIAAEKPVAE